MTVAESDAVVVKEALAYFKSLLVLEGKWTRHCDKIYHEATESANSLAVSSPPSPQTQLWPSGVEGWVAQDDDEDDDEDEDDEGDYWNSLFYYEEEDDDDDEPKYETDEWDEFEDDDSILDDDDSDLEDEEGPDLLGYDEDSDLDDDYYDDEE
jgi:hypothetical protein